MALNAIADSYVDLIAANANVDNRHVFAFVLTLYANNLSRLRHLR